LKGHVKEFERKTMKFECMLVFKGPGYAPTFSCDRDSASTASRSPSSNAVAIMNDLHKPRQRCGLERTPSSTDQPILMAVMSLSGFGLLFTLKKRRA